MSQASFALLGGRESGKTTYLGALLNTLEDGKSHRLALRAESPTDTTAHDRLIRPLLEADYPQRTKAERHTLELPLRIQNGAPYEDFSLLVGDYDGEEIEHIFTYRAQSFSPEWRARANARGLLIFFRPNALVELPKSTLAQDADDTARWKAIPEKKAPKKQSRSSNRSDSPERVFGPGLVEEPSEPRRAAPHEPVRVPTALAVVELLQFLRHVRGLDPGERPPIGELRVAFVATAWDAIDRDWRKAGPARFLAAHAPLLEDYLWSNFHPDDVFRFGLSATGGDLRDPRYKEQYLDDPHGFVEWADPTGAIQHTLDLASPIAWLLLGDRALDDARSSA